jgi:2'-5' RNA ligase
VEGGERLRLFVALPLPEETVERLVAWQREALAVARRARIVPRENLHVTLVFLGHRPTKEVASILEAVRASAVEVERPSLAATGYRETRSVGMVVLDDEGGRATRLAERLAARLEQLGVYEPEPRSWLPHITVLRFRERPRLSPDPPDLGPVSPSEVALYHSVLRRSGAQYEIRESVSLGG